MTFFEQVEVIAKTAKVACKRPLNNTEKTAFGLLFTLCEEGKKLEAENAELKERIKAADLAIAGLLRDLKGEMEGDSDGL